MLQLSLSDKQTTALLELVSQLSKWNRTYNLTALRDAGQALVHHVFDSLAAVPPLQRWWSHEGRGPLRILDVGSGGGLPGIVLAIALPEAHIICVDAVDKKVSFIRQMAGVLGLNNLEARHTRIEDVEPLGCDIVISRAFASLGDFARLAGRHVTPAGWLVGMKGKIPEQEIAELAGHSDWIARETQLLSVPELEAERCLVWMNRRETK
jgi:16S rRNA (guanine527-N7)-methyltransferase